MSRGETSPEDREREGPGAPQKPDRLFDLSDKVAVVTGASRGIGRQIALGYAAAGAHVALLSRTQEDLDLVAGEIRDGGGEALALACHTGRRQAVEETIERVADAWGGVDVLVNNAATNPHFGPLLSSEESHWDKTFEVNVKGYFWTVRAVAPSMRERGGGKVINVASVAGRVPFEGLGIYSVSKAAVLMLTRQLAAELVDDGIQVNAIAPGLIRTRFSEALWKDPELSARNLAHIPQRRFGEPRELVGAALYLASGASDFTTGEVLTVDGGQSLGAAFS